MPSLGTGVGVEVGCDIGVTGGSSTFAIAPNVAKAHQATSQRNRAALRRVLATCAVAILEMNGSRSRSVWEPRVCHATWNNWVLRSSASGERAG